MRTGSFYARVGALAKRVAVQMFIFRPLAEPSSDNRDVRTRPKQAGPVSHQNVKRTEPVTVRPFITWALTMPDAGMAAEPS